MCDLPNHPIPSKQNKNKNIQSFTSRHVSVRDVVHHADVLLSGLAAPAFLLLPVFDVFAAVDAEAASGAGNAGIGRQRKLHL